MVLPAPAYQLIMRLHLKLVMWKVKEDVKEYGHFHFLDYFFCYLWHEYVAVALGCLK